MPLCSFLKKVLGKYWVTSEVTYGCLIENEVTAAVTLFLVEPHPSCTKSLEILQSSACHRRHIGYNPIGHRQLLFSFLSFLLRHSNGTSWLV